MDGWLIAALIIWGVGGPAACYLIGRGIRLAEIRRPRPGGGFKVADAHVEVLRDGQRRVDAVPVRGRRWL